MENKGLAGLKVKCPNCKKIFWETTDKFDPNIRPNGSMVRLLEPWKQNGWPIFGDGIMFGTAGTLSSEMDCIGCLSQLAPSGRLMIIDPAMEEMKIKVADKKVQDEIEAVNPTPEPVKARMIVEEIDENLVCNADSLS